jgi:hypothetical protein
VPKCSVILARIKYMYIDIESVNSLREFPENCVYRQGGFNCFMKYLHRKLLTTNFSLMILKVLKKRAFIGFVY